MANKKKTISIVNLIDVEIKKTNPEHPIRVKEVTQKTFDGWGSKTYKGKSYEHAGYTINEGQFADQGAPDVSDEAIALAASAAKGKIAPAGSKADKKAKEAADKVKADEAKLLAEMEAEEAAKNADPKK